MISGQIWPEDIIVPRLLSINAQIAATIAIFGSHHRWGPMAAMIGLSSWPGLHSWR